MSQMNNEQLAQLLQQVGATLSGLTQRVSSMEEPPQPEPSQPEPPNAIVATVPTAAVKLSSHPAMMNAPSPRDEKKTISKKEEVKTTCKGITKAGQQCKKSEMPGLNGYCTLHKDQHSPVESKPTPVGQEVIVQPAEEVQKPLKGTSSTLELVAVGLNKLVDQGLVTVQYRDAKNKKNLMVVKEVSQLIPPHRDRVRLHGQSWWVRSRTWVYGEDGRVGRVVIDLLPEVQK